VWIFRTLRRWWERHMPLKHTWRCPVKGCKDPEISSYSEVGLDTLIRFHTEEHKLEEIRRIREFDQAQKKQIKKDISKLQITVIDMGFLKTRNIAIDDDMELVADGYGSQHSYWKSGSSDLPTERLGKPVDPPNIAEYGDRA
jgi:hypothetical protein